MPSRQTITLSIAVVAALAIGPTMYFLHRQPQPQPTELWAQLGKYCVDCHNRDDLTAGIAFDKMSAADIAREPEVFEAAIRKLRGNQMPPPGSASRRPRGATRSCTGRDDPRRGGRARAEAGPRRASQAQPNRDSKLGSVEPVK